MTRRGDMADWQVRYIAEHRDDRPRRLVAEAAGVSLSSLYRALRLLGAELHHELSGRNGRYEAEVRRLWPAMSAREVAEAAGIPPTTAKRVAERLGLEHTPETRERLRRKCLAGLRRWTPERRAEAGRRRRALYRVERLRVMSGGRQRTRVRLGAVPPRTLKAMWRLARCAGYSRTADPYTMERPDTPLMRVDEAHYERRYRITFTDRKREGEKRDD